MTPNMHRPTAGSRRRSVNRTTAT